MNIKLKKSVAKRIRVTRRGKIVRRPMGTDHFRTRKSKNNVRGKRKTRSLDFPLHNL